jgi:DNA repair photolyase
MNAHQVSSIKLTPDVVDAIVFWTKNPLPMLDRLDDLKNYTYCFQFTITPYGKDVEPNIPSKNDVILSTFKRLSDMIGADRIIWRYDPIMLSEKYSMEYHIHAFDKIAANLHKYTRKVTISFIDDSYRGVKSNIKALRLSGFPLETQIKLSSQLAKIAHGYGLTIDTCTEAVDLCQFGIEHARCIDDRLFRKLLDCHLNVDKDKTQRLECGCVASIDIGMYNTCSNGCCYCYANHSHKAVASNVVKHNPLSPLISGEISEKDKINERVAKSCKDVQLHISGI